MNNYTIKKVLPRLIIGAVLVNSSFIICQVLVDVSNVLGGTIVAIFNQVSVGGDPGPWGSATWGGAAVVGATVLASGAVALLAISGPVIVAVFLSVVVTLLILIGRQAAVILLTVISPLAFLAYTLPNTEQFFKKWIKTFWALLVVFPLVALLFGAGNLAYRVLGSSGDTGMQIAALGAAAIPLLAVVPLLRKSLDSLGAVGATLKGWGSRADKRIGEKISNDSFLGARREYKNQRLRNRQSRRMLVLSGGYEGKGGKLNPLNLLSAAHRAYNTSRISGQAGTNMAAYAANMATKMQLENVEAQTALIKQANLPEDKLLAIARGQEVKGSGIDHRDVHARAAAMKQLAEIGDYNRLNQAWDFSRSTESVKDRQTIINALNSSDKMPTWFGHGARADYVNGGAKSAQEYVDQAIVNNSYSSQVIATASREELEVVTSRVEALHNSDDAAKRGGAKQTAQNAADALSNPNISMLIGKNRGGVVALSRVANIDDGWPQT